LGKQQCEENIKKERIQGLTRRPIKSGEES
jgi:hypothetical protein